MLGLEAMSTAAAIAKTGHPSDMDRGRKDRLQDPGAFIFYYEYMTAMTGRMMGRPFDQPGSNRGKIHTYGLMGRKGFEEDAAEAKDWFKKYRASLSKFRKQMNTDDTGRL